MSEEVSVLFEIMQTTRSMRRLKPDPVPAALIRKILEAGVSAIPGGRTSTGHKPRALRADARCGPIPWRPHSRSSGVDHSVYAGCKPNPNGGVVNLPGSPEHAFGGEGARSRSDADDPVSELRERRRSCSRLASRCAFLCAHPYRLSDGPLRAGSPCSSCRCDLWRPMGSA